MSLVLADSLSKSQSLSSPSAGKANVGRKAQQGELYGNL